MPYSALSTSALPKPQSPMPDASGVPGQALPWLVLENTIVGISYMRDRHFLWANARMAEIFGYGPGELDGRPVRLLYVNQQDYDEIGQLMRGFSPDGFYSHERPMVRKDGTLTWCLISGRLLAPGDPGTPSIWVVQDLNDKRQIEDRLRRLNQRLEHTIERRTLNLRRSNEALRSEIERRRELQALAVDSREKYRALFRHLPLGVLVTDETGAIAEVNPTLQAVLGAPTRRQLDVLLNDTSRVILPNEQTCSLETLVLSYGQAGGQRVNRFEFGWLKSSGSLRHITVVAAPLASSKRGMLFTFADVTEQRQQQQRKHEQQAALAHASRLSLMGQMTSALAHELGQPLNACQSYLSGIRHRLEEALAHQPDVRQALDKAVRHLEQAGQIIRNVRGFMSRQTPVFEATDIDGLIRQTLALMELPLRSAQAQVRLHAPGADAPLPAVRGRPVEIQQVLVNLLINALDAMADLPARERRIDLHIACEDAQMLRVDVIDQGPGIEANIAARLFDPYFTTKPSGLGMGLMISRTIIEWHGGVLRHLPARRGAHFRFTLPVWQVPPEGDPA